VYCTQFYCNAILASLFRYDKYIAVESCEFYDEFADRAPADAQELAFNLERKRRILIANRRAKLAAYVALLIFILCALIAWSFL
jgi:hypothetical protein